MASGRCYLWLTLAAVVPFLPAITGEFVWLDKTEIVDGGYRITTGADFVRVVTMSLDEYLERNHGRFSTAGR